MSTYADYETATTTGTIDTAMDGFDDVFTDITEDTVSERIDIDTTETRLVIAFDYGTTYTGKLN
jgi:hypothetical protein